MNPVYHLNKLLTKASIMLAPLLKGYCLGGPQAIVIETTTVCNLKCRLCTVNKQERVGIPFIPVESVREIAEFIGGHCDTYVVSNWGEPLLHPRIMDILEILKDKKLILSTNLNIPNETIKKLCAYQAAHKNIYEFGVSTDGYDEESYKNYYRLGGNWDLLRGNLETISACPELKTRTHLQFLQHDNADFISKCVAFASGSGFRYRLKELNLNFSTDRDIFHGTERCEAMYLDIVFTTEKQILYCCGPREGRILPLTMETAGSYGNLWNGPLFRKMRLNMLKNKNRHLSGEPNEVCKRCPGYKV